MTKGNNNKGPLIFFDLYEQNEKSSWKDVLVGCYSVPMHDLSEISAKGIYEYIRDNWNKFTDYYEFGDILDNTLNFHAYVIRAKNPRAYLTVSNIHKI